MTGPRWEGMCRHGPFVGQINVVSKVMTGATSSAALAGFTEESAPRTRLKIRPRTRPSWRAWARADVRSAVCIVPLAFSLLHTVPARADMDGGDSQVGGRSRASRGVTAVCGRSAGPGALTPNPGHNLLGWDTVVSSRAVRYNNLTRLCTCHSTDAPLVHH